MLYTNSRLIPLSAKQERNYNKKTEFVTITSEIENETLIIKLYKDNSIIININQKKFITKSSNIIYSDFANFIDIKELFYPTNGKMLLYIRNKLYTCTNHYALTRTYDVCDFDSETFYEFLKRDIIYEKEYYESLSKEEQALYLSGLSDKFPNDDYESRLNDLSYINKYDDYNDEELRKLTYGYDSIYDLILNGGSEIRTYIGIYRYHLNLKYYDKIKNSSIKLLYVPYAASPSLSERNIQKSDKFSYLLQSSEIKNESHMCVFNDGGYISKGSWVSELSSLPLECYLVDSNSIDELLVEFENVSDEIESEYIEFKKEIEKIWEEIKD